jgi:hypothetical protein
MPKYVMTVTTGSFIISKKVAVALVHLIMFYVTVVNVFPVVNVLSALSHSLSYRRTSASLPVKIEGDSFTQCVCGSDSLVKVSRKILP